MYMGNTEPVSTASPSHHREKNIWNVAVVVMRRVFLSGSVQAVEGCDVLFACQDMTRVVKNKGYL